MASLKGVIQSVLEGLLPKEAAVLFIAQEPLGPGKSFFKVSGIGSLLKLVPPRLQIAFLVGRSRPRIQRVAFSGFRVLARNDKLPFFNTLI